MEGKWQEGKGHAKRGCGDAHVVPLLLCCSGKPHCSFPGRSLTFIYNACSPHSSEILTQRPLEMAVAIAVAFICHASPILHDLNFAQTSLSEWGLRNSLLPNSRWNFGNIVKVLML